MGRRAGRGAHRKAETERNGSRVHHVHRHGRGVSGQLGRCDGPGQLAGQVHRDDPGRPGRHRARVRVDELLRRRLRGAHTCAALQGRDELLRTDIDPLATRHAVDDHVERYDRDARRRGHLGRHRGRRVGHDGDPVARGWVLHQTASLRGVAAGARTAISGPAQLGTTLTSRGARTMTVRTPPPARARRTPGVASARSRSSSSPIDGATSSRSRTLPATWTMHVTVSSTSSAGSTVGQPTRATVGAWPSSDHISSARYGVYSESSTATASTASRTAGSAPPAPVSIALRVALTSSITRATTTLNLKDSTRPAASCTVLCVIARSAVLPVRGSTPGALVTSRASRQARARNFAEPCVETSAQSTSSSGGPENAIVSRIASTPNSSSVSESGTMLPRDLLIADPSICTMPWLSSRVKGSEKSTRSMSFRTLVKKRAYSRCRIACVTPPTYWSTGAQALASAGSNATSSRRGDRYRKKYQDESTKVSIVSVSRCAAPPHCGQSIVSIPVRPPR